MGQTQLQAPEENQEQSDQPPRSHGLPFLVWFCVVTFVIYNPIRLLGMDYQPLDKAIRWYIQLWGAPLRGRGRSLAIRVHSSLTFIIRVYQGSSLLRCLRFLL